MTVASIRALVLPRHPSALLKLAAAVVARSVLVAERSGVAADHRPQAQAGTAGKTGVAADFADYFVVAAYRSW